MSKVTRVLNEGVKICNLKYVKRIDLILSVLTTQKTQPKQNHTQKDTRTFLEVMETIRTLKVIRGVCICTYSSTCVH